MDGATVVRYILRSQDGSATLIVPGTTRPYEYPSEMAAIRGRAMVDHRAQIIQQRLTSCSK
jgi:hypothetical protein